MIVESYEDVIILSGALRSNHWETLHTAISLALRRHPNGVIIDCSGLLEVTPHGADTFRSVMEFLEDHDARVIVAAVPDPVMTVLRTVPDVRSQLPIVNTVDDARQSLDLLGHSETEGQKKKKSKVSSMHVMAVLSGSAGDKEVLWTAREIVNNLSGMVHLVYPLIVPRELPLQAALPDEEAAAKAALEAAAEFFGSETPCDVTLERGRDIASTVAVALEETAIGHVILGLPRSEDGQDACGKLVRTVLAKVPCAVHFVREPLG